MARGDDHPFLRPLWRRVALIVFCAAWTVFEFATGSTGWGIGIGALTVYGAWTYLINYKPAPDPAESRE